MLRKFGLAASVGILAAGAFMVAAPAPAPAQSSGVKAGSLTCNVSSGWGFVFGSSRSLRCTYSPSSGAPEHYTGTIKKFGVDIGYVSGAVMVWVVVAPSSDVAPGALSGDYVGATASASVGVGVGANALVGGSNKSIALQPLSIEGNQGLNVAGGIGAITLKHQP
jgi:hypothetical protein